MVGEPSARTEQFYIVGGQTRKRPLNPEECPMEDLVGMGFVEGPSPPQTAPKDVRPQPVQESCRGEMPGQSL
jgi:hypothetical protein